MTNGITFDTMSGIDMTGWWYNHRTGDNIRVVDQFFEDNNLVVRTADNRILPYRQIESYVKTDKPIKKDDGFNAPKKTTQLPKSITDEIETYDDDGNAVDVVFDDDAEMLSRYDMRHGNTSTTTSVSNNNLNESLNKLAIQRTLSKLDDMIFEYSIVWDDDYMKMIDMLTGIMEIPKEEIIDFITDKYFDVSREHFKAALWKFIFNE